MKRRVLIVEDEPTVALDLHEQVEELGCEVVGIAESAEHAMAIAEIYRPDLALMDINILGSMDGIQTARLLSCTYQIPSVFLTSCNDEATMKRAMQELTYGYLTKPFKTHQLKATLMVAFHMIEAEEADRADHGQIVAAVTAMSAGLLTISLEGEIQFMNAAAERVTSVLPRDARGKQLNEILAMEDGFKIDRHHMMAPGDWPKMEGIGRTLESSHGDSLPVNVSFAPMFDNGGKLTGYAVTLRTMTEQLYAEAVALTRN
jgi:two-component system, cell cycle sensor histidine kinase and response regulator CckA